MKSAAAKSSRSSSKKASRGGSATRERSAAKKASPAAVQVRPKTLRLEPRFETGLGLLKEILHKPVNKMVNEAVGEYIQKRSAEVETEMTSVVERLRAFRRADSDFRQDKEAFVAAEAELAGSDPMEGTLYDVERSDRQSAPRRAAKKAKAGPALSLVRDLLRS
jgi:hypothetical protein